MIIRKTENTFCKMPDFKALFHQCMGVVNSKIGSTQLAKARVCIFANSNVLTVATETEHYGIYRSYVDFFLNEKQELILDYKLVQEDLQLDAINLAKERVLEIFKASVVA